MKKRTRKKRHLKEYRLYGYSWECEWTNQCDEIIPEEDSTWKKYDIEYSTFWDDLIEWHESRDFDCGGGSNNKTIGWVTESWESKSQKYQTSPTEDDKNDLIEWLKLRPEIKSIKVTDRIDLCDSICKSLSDEEDRCFKYTFEWVKL